MTQAIETGMHIGAKVRKVENTACYREGEVLEFSPCRSKALIRWTSETRYPCSHYQSRSGGIARKLLPGEPTTRAINVRTWCTIDSVLEIER